MRFSAVYLTHRNLYIKKYVIFYQCLQFVYILFILGSQALSILLLVKTNNTLFLSHLFHPFIF